MTPEHFLKAILVKYLWTLSMRDTSETVQGDQTWGQYSRIGRQYEINALPKWLTQLNWSERRTEFETRIAFFTRTEQWYDQFGVKIDRKVTDIISSITQNMAINAEKTLVM